MKRRWKILIGIAVCLLVALAVLVFSLNGVVRVGIERAATAVLGAQTTVQSVRIGLLDGSAEIRGLVIANPREFEEGNLLELGRIEVALKVSSLLSDTIQVDRVVLEAPVLKLRQKGLDTNLQTILKNASGTESKEARGKAESGPPGAKKFGVGLIKITDGQLEYSLGSAPAAKIPLADIELKDISNADGSPVMFKDILVQVFSAMAKSAASALKGVISEDAGQALTGAATAAEQGVKDAVKGVGGAIKDAGEAVKGIFKKD